jgi:RNA polymerase sigma-70 factor (ECF subfamily)
VHIDLLKKKSSLFIEITDREINTNIKQTTTLSAEDELIWEQNLSRLLRYIKENHIIRKLYIVTFSKMTYQEIANAINEPLSSVKVKLLRAKIIS